MTTGCTCPTCPNGITSKKDEPCRDCQIDAMPGGVRKVMATFVRDHIDGPSRHQMFAKDKEIGQ
jgi:hypothetical protein